MSSATGAKRAGDLLRSKVDACATPRDYDSDPNRFHQATRGTSIYLAPGVNLYAMIAACLADLDGDRLLDIGCGDGAMGDALDHGSLVNLDASMSLLRRARGPAVRADACALPFPDYTFDAAVAVNVSDHLTDPVLALREARRVLGPGGALVAGVISRHDYLIARFVSWRAAEQAARQMATPLPLTKRGALIIGRRSFTRLSTGSSGSAAVDA